MVFCLVMWPFTRSHWVFQPPPCICEEIEAHVKDACALRDEMATWDTPLNEWKKLQQMQILVPKTKPSTLPIRNSQPYVDVWSSEYARAMRGSVRVSSTTYINYTTTPDVRVPIYDGRRGFVLQLRPGEPFEVGSIIKRGDTRYQITERLFDNTNRVKAKQVRWPL